MNEEELGEIGSFERRQFWLEVIWTPIDVLEFLVIPLTLFS